MYACKSANVQELFDLFGDSWDMVEGVHKNEHFKFHVVISSVCFTFLKSHSTLSIYFRFEQWHWKRNTWVSIQAQEELIKVLDLYICFPSNGIQLIQPRESWTLSNAHYHLENLEFEGLCTASLKLNGRKVLAYMF